METGIAPPLSVDHAASAPENLDILPPEATAPHAHHWRIGAQGSATSSGTCTCGAEREFKNTWDREPAGWAGSPRRGARLPRH